MKKILFAVAIVLSSFGWASAQVELVEVSAADYYQGQNWGSGVAAISDSPFSKVLDCSDIQFYTKSSAGSYTLIDHITNHTCQVVDSSPSRGLPYYTRSWIVEGPDLPFSPLWCTDDPHWVDFCGSRGNELLHIHTVNALGQVGHSDFVCKSISRGAFCN